MFLLSSETDGSKTNQGNTHVSFLNYSIIKIVRWKVTDSESIKEFSYVIMVAVKITADDSPSDNVTRHPVYPPLF